MGGGRGWGTCTTGLRRCFSFVGAFCFAILQIFFARDVGVCVCVVVMSVPVYVCICVLCVSKSFRRMSK